MKNDDIKVGDFVLVRGGFHYTVNEAYFVVNIVDNNIWIIDHHSNSELRKVGRSTVLDHKVPTKFISKRYVILEIKNDVVRKVMPTCPLAKKAKEFEESLR